MGDFLERDLEGSSTGLVDLFADDGVTDLFEDDDGDSDTIDLFEEDYDLFTDDADSANSDVNTPLMSKEDNDFSFTVDFAPEDLQNGVVVEDYQSNFIDNFEEHLVDELSYKKEELLTLGYLNVNNLSEDELNRLFEREGMINSITIQQVVDVYAEKLATLCEALSTSQATLINTESDPLKFQKNNLMKYQNQDLNKFRNLTMYALRKLKDGETVTVESLLTSINLNINTFKSIRKEDLKAIESAIAAAKDIYRNDKFYSQNVVLFRKYSSKYLLQQEIDALEELKEQSNSNKVRFVKNLVKDSSGVKFVCPFCGKEESIHKYMSLIMFSGEKGLRTFFVPRIMSCGCGNSCVFTPDEYAELSKFILTSSESSLSLYTNSMQKSSSGTAVLRLIPGNNTLENALNYLILNRGDETILSNHVINTGTENVLEPVDMHDFIESVQRFYKGLAKFNAKTYDTSSDFTEKIYKLSNIKGISVDEAIQLLSNDMEHLSYKEVAFYVTTVLSKNYTDYKNKAIFSILFYFDENKILKDFLKSERIWDLRNDIILVDSAKQDKQLSEEKFKELFALYAFCSNGPIKENELNMTADELLHKLSKQIDKMETIISDTQKQKTKFLKDLKELSSIFAYYKIINISNYKLIDFDSYCNSKEIFEVLDEISDKMIITNLAPEFYNYYITLRKVNRATIEGNVNKKTQKDEIIQSIIRMVKKLVEPGIIPGREINYSEYFELCHNMTASHLEQLSKLSNEFKNLNFYRFCMIVNDIPSDLNLHLNDFCQNAFVQFINKAKDVASRVTAVEEYVYYLTDFSLEEIDEFRDQLEEFEFGHLIPYRLENESLGDYLNRYKELKNSYELSIRDSRDFSTQFEQFSDYYALIISCGMPYNASYKSFSASTFINALIDVLIKNVEKGHASEVLGIPSAYLTMLLNENSFLKFDSLKSELNESTYRLLTGVYFTSVLPLIEQQWSKYNEIFLRTTNNLDEKYKLYNIVQEMNKIICMEDFNVNNSSDYVNDKEEALEEMRLFVNSDKLLDVLEG